MLTYKRKTSYKPVNEFEYLLLAAMIRIIASVTAGSATKVRYRCLNPSIHPTIHPRLYKKRGEYTSYNCCSSSVSYIITPIQRLDKNHHM